MQNRRTHIIAGHTYTSYIPPIGGYVAYEEGPDCNVKGFSHSRQQAVNDVIDKLNAIRQERNEE
jgi:hypothetical protein